MYLGHLSLPFSSESTKDRKQAKNRESCPFALFTPAETIVGTIPDRFL
jgi:hypothetical protein